MSREPLAAARTRGFPGRAQSGPTNAPTDAVPIGLFRLRIPSFPVEVIREAVLNAVTHRNYMDPGEVLVRHMADQLAVTSPGGFIAGITTRNILLKKWSGDAGFLRREGGGKHVRYVARERSYP